MFIWFEPLLRGHLSYKAIFTFSQMWPLNTGQTVYWCDIISMAAKDVLSRKRFLKMCQWSVKMTNKQGNTLCVVTYKTWERKINMCTFNMYPPPSHLLLNDVKTAGVIVPWYFYHYVIFICNKAFTQPFDFERTRSRSFQKRVVHTKFDILRLYYSKQYWYFGIYIKMDKT